MSSLTHGQRRAQIGAMVERWLQLTSAPRMPLVGPGSSLARDDTETFPDRPASHLAWHGILTAVDHLAMFMHAVESGRAFALAPQTLARSGLLGAAHAVWLLQPNEREQRVRRALQMAHAEAAEELKAVRAMGTLPTDDLLPPARAQRWQATQTQIDRCENWKRQIAAEGARRRFTETATKPGETDLIDNVVRESMASGALDANDRALLASYQVMWRTHSGSAHGYVWPAIYRTRATITLPGGGGMAQVSINEAEMVTSAAAVATLTSRAIQLFGLRADRPEVRG